MIIQRLFVMFAGTTDSENGEESSNEPLDLCGFPSAAIQDKDRSGESEESHGGGGQGSEGYNVRETGDEDPEEDHVGDDDKDEEVFENAGENISDKNMKVENWDQGGATVKYSTWMNKLKMHFQLPSETATYNCGVCHQTFDEIEKLTTHKQTHRVQSSHVCDVCHFRFCSDYQLRLHKTMHSVVEQRFDCDVCHKKTTTKLSLEQHLKVHRKEDRKKFQCATCPKKFVKASGLTRHERYHATGSVQCQICSRLFSARSYLKVHMNRVHALPTSSH